ncbi:MAG: hypothetical protein HFF42_08920 [Lawsonibacter sp.]|jgi:hypothetical protein|nr:hypothetical protein [Lawsonibacter sp.]
MPKKKKKTAAEGEEPQEGKKKKKKGKKKLLLIPVALILVAAVAAAVILLILPRFGINLLGDKEQEPQIEEPIPKKGVEAYTVGEDTVASLDTILEEGEGELLALRTTPEQSKAEEEGRHTYIYEVNGNAAIVNRYLDLVLSGEVGFSLVDENYVIQEERPELVDEEGALMVAKASAVEGKVFQMAIGWSLENNMLAVRISVPEAQLRKPEKVEPPKPASLSEQLDTIQTMHPSELGLSGRSMDQYEVLSTTGFVKVDDILCRRFTIYEKTGDDKRGDIVKVVYFSGDQQHMFQQETDENGKLIITELVT